MGFWREVYMSIFGNDSANACEGSQTLKKSFRALWRAAPYYDLVLSHYIYIYVDISCLLRGDIALIAMRTGFAAWV